MTKMICRRCLATVAWLLPVQVIAFPVSPVVQPSTTSSQSTTTSLDAISRRSLLEKAAFLGTTSSILLSSPQIANAGIDPTLLKTLPVQGDESGAAQRLRQVEAIQRPATDLEDKPFEKLESGVSYREYREGKGDAGM